MILQNTKKSRSVIQQLFKLQGEYVYVKENDRLFHEMDKADCFYLVLDGSIELIFHAEAIRTFSKKIVKNEFFGFEELFGAGKRVNTAIAIEDSELLRISALDSEPAKNVNTPLIHKEKKINLLSQSKLDSGSIRVTESGDIKIIHCNFQRANLTNALAFKTFIFDLIHRGAKKIIIDLGSCKIVDSTFLGSLIVILKEISSVGGKFRLVCSSDVCSWLFVMASMDKVFEIHNTVEEALNSISI